MSDLERFLNDLPEPTPVLLKAALAHVQFETIHPFLDGNGRVGRLLITLLLCHEKVLRAPMLYLSLYFKTHRRHYYELLNGVRSQGDWESWLDFFAEAVVVSATQGVDTAQQLAQLCERDRYRIGTLGRAAVTALQVHRLLLQQPLVSSNWLVEKTGRSAATINKALASLQQVDVLRELTSGRRNRLFCYHEYVEILNRGAELPG